ncbi:MAG: WbqC family protein [Alloprevotella sp.]|nr:WbqC family protein [Alloprevotella sp.]
MKANLFATAYMAPVQQFCRLIQGGRMVEERCENYVKQTYRNRAVILGSNGPVALTIPIERTGENHIPIAEALISPHNNWRHNHWQTLLSAYESSPFFRFYADELREVLFAPTERLVDFNEMLLRLFCRWLFIDLDLSYTQQYEAHPSDETVDFRSCISPKCGWRLDEAFTPVPYYQVFGARFGFIPNLSIADLVFNMGPASRLVLLDSLKK